MSGFRTAASKAQGSRVLEGNRVQVVRELSRELPRMSPHRPKPYCPWSVMGCSPRSLLAVHLFHRDHYEASPATAFEFDFDLTIMELDAEVAETKVRSLKFVRF